MQDLGKFRVAPPTPRIWWDLAILYPLKVFTFMIALFINMLKGFMLTVLPGRSKIRSTGPSGKYVPDLASAAPYIIGQGDKLWSISPTPFSTTKIKPLPI